MYGVGFRHDWRRIERVTLKKKGRETLREERQKKLETKGSRDGKKGKRRDGRRSRRECDRWMEIKKKKN